MSTGKRALTAAYNLIRFSSQTEAFGPQRSEDAYKLIAEVGALAEESGWKVSKEEWQDFAYFTVGSARGPAVVIGVAYNVIDHVFVLASEEMAQRRTVHLDWDRATRSFCATGPDQTPADELATFVAKMAEDTLSAR